MGTTTTLLSFVICVFGLLPTSLYAQPPGHIPIEVHPASSNWWVGLRMVGDAGPPIMSVEIGESAHWSPMRYDDGTKRKGEEGEGLLTR